MPRNCPAVAYAGGSEQVVLRPMRYGYIRVSRANDDGSTTLGNQRRQLAAADVAGVAGGGRLIAVIALELAAIEREKIAERAKLREGTTTILPRGRALQGVGLSSMRFHPIGGGPEDDKEGQEAWFTARIASLIG